MRAKTARRFLSRNRWELKRKELEGIKPPFLKKCLKRLREDMRTVKNPASIRAYNQYMYL